MPSGKKLLYWDYMKPVWRVKTNLLQSRKLGIVNVLASFGINSPFTSNFLDKEGQLLGS